MVPYIGWTFVVYLTLYLYYPAAAWFGRDSDEKVREMFAFYQALFVMTWVINLIFIIFPTEVYIRDQIPADVRAGEGFWGFWQDSKRILKGFCKDPGRLLEESGRFLEILEGFWEDSGSIPY